MLDAPDGAGAHGLSDQRAMQVKIQIDGTWHCAVVLSALVAPCIAHRVISCTATAWPRARWREVLTVLTAF